MKRSLAIVMLALLTLNVQAKTLNCFLMSQDMDSGGTTTMNTKTIDLDVFKRSWDSEEEYRVAHCEKLSTAEMNLEICDKGERDNLALDQSLTYTKNKEETLTITATNLNEQGHTELHFFDHQKKKIFLSSCAPEGQ